MLFLSDAITKVGLFNRFITLQGENCLPAIKMCSSRKYILRVPSRGGDGQTFSGISELL